MPAYDVIVIGAGAAGMMCAAQAGQRGRRVLLIDHYPKLGEKIRISGGGRCNFTNINAGPGNFLSQNPDFCRSALARYTPRDFITLVERHGIAYHEKKLGQLFCDVSARAIIDALRDECVQGRVEWRMPCSVDAVEATADGFRLAMSQGAVTCASLVVATGGLTVPKIGASPFGYRIAEQFGLTVVPPRPALVPLACPPEFLARFGALAGVAVEAEVSHGAGRFRDSVLFTHRGLSGPALLQISSYWDGRTPIVIDLLPDLDAPAWLAAHAGSARHIDHLLGERLPARLAQHWCVAHDVAGPVRGLSAVRLRALGAALKRWSVVPSGTLGYNKAEVTLGGVDTRGLSSKTMAATTRPHLFFIGEVVDVTGWLGGYNFQWAWASGHAAAQFA
jgi:predicted Rossmann fold flavoprotein